MVDDINRPFADGFTSLAVAAMVNQTDIVKKLLTLGAQVDVSTPDRRLTPLHLACEFASEDVVELLLDAGADPHATSTSGTTPFYRAARGGCIPIIKRLKACGSDVNARTWDNWTPLMEAVENGWDDVVDLLLEFGADPCIASSEGLTPLELAESLPYPSIMRKLQKAVGKDLSHTENETATGSRIEQKPDTYKDCPTQ
jgi:ankyrin repeat protein